ncbi:MAG: hypothetical protein KA116_09605 [Proteobacteria bacterium]|nr:hypothetical protein [Pseudomonadota bacterium]
MKKSFKFLNIIILGFSSSHFSYSNPENDEYLKIANDQGEFAGSLYDYYVDKIRNGSEDDFLSALYNLQIDYTDGGKRLSVIRGDLSIHKLINERANKIAKEHNFPSKFYMGSIDRYTTMSGADSLTLRDLRHGETELNFTNFYKALVAKRFQEAKSAKDWLKAAETELPLGRKEWEGIKSSAVEAHEMRFYELNPTTEDLAVFKKKFRRGGLSSVPVTPYFEALRAEFLKNHSDYQKAWIPDEDLIPYALKLMKSSKTSEALRLEAIKYCLSLHSIDLERTAILNLKKISPESRLNFLSELTQGEKSWAKYKIGGNPVELLQVLDFSDPRSLPIALSVRSKSVIDDWIDYENPDKNQVALYDLMASNKNPVLHYNEIPAGLAAAEMEIRKRSNLPFQFHEAMKNWMASPLKDEVDLDSRMRVLRWDYNLNNRQFREAEIFANLNDHFAQSIIEKFLKRKGNEGVSSLLIKKLLQYERNPARLEPWLSRMYTAYTKKPHSFASSKFLGMWNDWTEILSNRAVREHLQKMYPDLLAFEGKNSILEATRKNLQGFIKGTNPLPPADMQSDYNTMATKIGELSANPHIDVWGPVSKEAHAESLALQKNEPAGRIKRWIRALVNLCSLSKRNNS